MTQYSNHHPSLSTLRSKGSSRSKMYSFVSALYSKHKKLKNQTLFGFFANLSCSAAFWRPHLPVPQIKGDSPLRICNIYLPYIICVYTYIYIYIYIYSLIYIALYICNMHILMYVVIHMYYAVRKQTSVSL